MTTVFVFPGQNSRQPDMLSRLLPLDPENRAVLRSASDVLGWDVEAHYRPDNPSIFARNRDVQIGVFLANVLHAGMLERRGVRADASAGLSLGEYNHLVDIGAISFETALELLSARGEAYDASPDGTMAAVFPVAVGDAEAAVARSGVPASISVAMRNSPRQQVLSGDRAAVRAAVAHLEDEHLANHAIIDDRLPMHSPLFAGVGRAFRPVLERAEWRSAAKPYLPNVLGRPIETPDAAVFVDSLARHVSEPVRWQRTVEHLAQREDSVFIEVGPGTVLFNMLRPRWTGRPRACTDGEHGVEDIDRTAREILDAA